jgi:RNA polymerase sigma factor (sigma-70 family)
VWPGEAGSTASWRWASLLWLKDWFFASALLARPSLKGTVPMARPCRFHRILALGFLSLAEIWGCIVSCCVPASLVIAPWMQIVLISIMSGCGWAIPPFCRQSLIPPLPLLRDPPLSLLGALVHHYDELVAHVRRRFGDAGFAREVVHDVCIRVIEKPPATPAARAPLALLRKISHDLAVDRCRTEDAYRARVQSTDTLPDAIAPAPSAEQIVDARRELQWLEDAIAAMPPRRQAVFVMHKIHEMPHAEVALRLGITHKAVEKHLHAGMADCRAHLAFARQDTA